MNMTTTNATKPLKVTKLTRTARGWTATVDGIAAYITDGNAYWFPEVAAFPSPLTDAHQSALDHAACLAAKELWG